MKSHSAPPISPSVGPSGGARPKSDEMALLTWGGGLGVKKRRSWEPKGKVGLFCVLFEKKRHFLCSRSKSKEEEIKKQSQCMDV